MVSRLVLVCVSVGLLPSVVRAQQADAPAAVPAPVTRSDLEAFALRIEAKVEQSQKAFEQSQKATDARVAALEEKVKALSDVQESGRQALEQIAKRDKDGTSYLRIDASHEPTRNELKKAISQIAPKVGTVVIDNKTDYAQSVVVNGTTYEVLARSKKPVPVAYRNFEVRTSNNKVLYWDFAYPKTRAVVDIKEIPNWMVAAQ